MLRKLKAQKMELFHKRTFTLHFDNEPRAIISESKGIFTTIDPNFKKWDLSEVERKHDKRQIQALTIMQFDAEESEKSKQTAHPYLYVQVYPEDINYYLFDQEYIVYFCKKCKDLLVGDNKVTLFYSRNNYEIFITEVRSTLMDGKAELQIRPIRLGDCGIIAMPTGGLQIFVIEDGFFTDGSKSSDIWGKTSG